MAAAVGSALARTADARPATRSTVCHRTRGTERMLAQTQIET